jgi:hypothetical protein
VATVIAAEGTRQETTGKVLGASVITMILYWLAHAYAHHLGSRLREPATWSFHEIFVSLAAAASILVGAAIPVLAMLGAWLAGGTLESGVTAALWCAGVELVGFELVASIRRHLGVRDLLVETSIGLAFGLGILGIRLLLH